MILEVAVVAQVKVHMNPTSATQPTRTKVQGSVASGDHDPTPNPHSVHSTNQSSCDTLNIKTLILKPQTLNPNPKP